MTNGTAHDVHDVCAFYMRISAIHTHRVPGTLSFAYDACSLDMSHMERAHVCISIVFAVFCSWMYFVYTVGRTSTRNSN